LDTRSRAGLHGLLAATILVAAPSSASAQVTDEPAAAGTPRVGLVLSGGGARGFAHLGVLKVLHELRIPVHAIAGTSMGAVVGGLYALGTPYPELERLFREEDWAGMFHDDPPRRELPMRRKRTDRDFGLGLEVGVGLDGVRLPPSLVTGSKLNNALRAHTWRPGRPESFDSLPIPFRAVAMDVADGSMVVLDHGDLAAAIRASMAVPEAFAPQEIDGRRLVDGGLVRNIPVDVARSMGVDVLIVSDVSTGLDEAGSGEDALSLASRLLSIVTTRPSLEQLETLGSADIYLKPDLVGVSSSDFSALDKALAAGQAVAREALPALRRLSAPAGPYAALEADRAGALPDPGTLVLRSVQVDTGQTALGPGVIEALLDVRPGETVTLDKLRTDLTRVHGYGGFQSVEFQVSEEADGAGTLTVLPRDKGWGPVLLRTGLSLLDRQRGADGWGLRTRLEWTRLSSLGGEAWIQLDLGTRQGLRTRVQLPLVSSEAFFLSGTASAGRRDVTPVDLTTVPIEADLSEREATVGAGVRLGWWGEATAELSAARFELDVNGSPDDGPPFEPLHDRSLLLQVEGDVLDQAYFPSSGHRLRLSWRRGASAIGGDAPYDHVVAAGMAALSRSHLTLTLSALVSSGVGTDVPLPRAPTLGGFEGAAGAPRDALWGPYAGMAKAGLSWRFGRPARDPSTGGIRLGVTAVAAQAWLTADEVDISVDGVRFGGSVWAGLGTPLGPLRLAWARLDGVRNGWIIQIGVEP
jgi:NTE family protein